MAPTSSRGGFVLAWLAKGLTPPVSSPCPTRVLQSVQDPVLLLNLADVRFNFALKKVKPVL